MVPLREIIEKDDSILSNQMRKLKQNAKNSKLNNLEDIIIDEIHCGGFRIIFRNGAITNEDIEILCKNIND